MTTGTTTAAVSTINGGTATLTNVTLSGNSAATMAVAFELPLPPIKNGIGPIDNGTCPNGSFDQRGVCATTRRGVSYRRRGVPHG